MNIFKYIYFSYPIQWTGDESRVAHLMTGAVTFYDGKLEDEEKQQHIAKLYVPVRVLCEYISYW
jgi:hypothetical protein